MCNKCNVLYIAKYNTKQVICHERGCPNFKPDPTVYTWHRPEPEVECEYCAHTISAGEYGIICHRCMNHRFC